MIVVKIKIPMQLIQVIKNKNKNYLRLKFIFREYMKMRVWKKIIVNILALFSIYYFNDLSSLILYEDKYKTWMLQSHMVMLFFMFGLIVILRKRKGWLVTNYWKYHLPLKHLLNNTEPPFLFTKDANFLLVISNKLLLRLSFCQLILSLINILQLFVLLL